MGFPNLGVMIHADGIDPPHTTLLLSKGELFGCLFACTVQGQGGLQRGFAPAAGKVELRHLAYSWLLYIVY